MQCGPLFVPFKKGLPLPSSLAKKRIYLDTQLKRDLISFPLWIKLAMGQLLLFFLCNFSSLFSFVMCILVTNHCIFPCYLIDSQVYFGYSANYNIRGPFAILFLICSNLLNFLRSFGTMIITTESG